MFDYTKHSLRNLLVAILAFVVIISGCRARSGEDEIPTSPSINPSLTLPVTIDQFPQFDGNTDIGPEYSPVAENAILRLYINKTSSAIIIEDFRKGTFWRSSPEDLETHEGTSQSWRKTINSPIQVSYVDAARAQQKNAKPEEALLSFQPVQDGIKVTYDIEDKSLAFDIIYALNDDCLEATIVSDSIVEEAENSLVSVDLLAFLGATHDDDQGYIVYPDGSGALVYFDTPHPPEVQKIITTIYGNDDVSDQGSVYKEQIAIPVFGLVRGQSAFVGMITQGEFDAELGIARSGKGVNYNHVWAQFLFRRQGRFSLTGGQPAWLYQPDRIPGDRQVRYCFINDGKANYVEMGSRYRQYLFEERGATRLGEQIEKDDIPLMNLNFFMGIERRNWFLADMVLMTRFEDIAQMMSELNTLGLKNADVTIWYWNEGGTRNKYPERLPVDKRVGSEEDLRNLIDGLHQQGYRVYLQDDYLFASPDSKAIQPFLDAVRGVDGLPAGDPELGYMLNPQVALRDFAIPAFPSYESFGADGMLFENFASVAFPDKNSGFPLGRENFAASWMQIANISRQRLGSTAMIGSNIYTVPFTDRLDFVTLDSTHYDIFDETIPLYHIAVHGLVRYTGIPYNLQSDSQRLFLHQVEYGALPAFLLTKQSSSLLFRTGANSIYSSKYETWQDEILRQYRAMENLAPLITQFITGHEKIDEGVFVTTYENGMQVIVNYTTSPYVTSTVSVPPQDFIVVGGN